MQTTFALVALAVLSVTRLVHHYLDLRFLDRYDLRHRHDEEARPASTVTELADSIGVGGGSPGKDLAELFQRLGRRK